MTNLEFIEKLKQALAAPTVYVCGCFGAPLDYGNNAKRYTTNYEYNIENKDKILSNTHRFGFDCVCLGKGILWGWNEDWKRVYGGADYTSNKVPDFSTESVPQLCGDTYSEDFSQPLVPGEWLYLKGHIGYVLDTETCIECTPAWTGNVQTSQIWNVKKTKTKGRKWKGHGKIKFLEYVEPAPACCPYWVNGKCTKPEPTPVIKVGDLVHITGNTYYSGAKIPQWVKLQNWYVYSAPAGSDRIVLDENEAHTSHIMSPVNAKDLEIVKSK